jgi:La domain
MEQRNEENLDDRTDMNVSMKAAFNSSSNVTTKPSTRVAAATGKNEVESGNVNVANFHVPSILCSNVEPLCADNRTQAAEEHHLYAVEELYIALARQLEYYFSPQNLFHDTYLQTLRNLNDGCVPISIVANFAKVQAILSEFHRTDGSCKSIYPVPSDCAMSVAMEPSSKKFIPKHQRLYAEEMQRKHAILHVVNQYYTDQLQIYSIDSQTGKVMLHGTTSSSNAILAVGLKPITGHPTHTVQDVVPVVEFEPLRQEEKVEGNTPVPASVGGNNTLILRDVNESVTVSEIQSLLDTLSDCPTIMSVVPDVANCW